MRLPILVTEHLLDIGHGERLSDLLLDLGQRHLSEDAMGDQGHPPAPREECPDLTLPPLSESSRGATLFEPGEEPVDVFDAILLDVVGQLEFTSKRPEMGEGVGVALDRGRGLALHLDGLQVGVDQIVDGRHPGCPFVTVIPHSSGGTQQAWRYSAASWPDLTSVATRASIATHEMLLGCGPGCLSRGRHQGAPRQCQSRARQEGPPQPRETGTPGLTAVSPQSYRSC